jgi:hypothetical protein
VIHTVAAEFQLRLFIFCEFEIVQLDKVKNNQTGNFIDPAAQIGDLVGIGIFRHTWRG